MGMFFKLPLNDVENGQIMGENAVTIIEGGGVDGVTPKVAPLSSNLGV
jgi:hypothetical protein